MLEERHSTCRSGARKQGARGRRQAPGARRQAHLSALWSGDTDEPCRRCTRARAWRTMLSPLTTALLQCWCTADWSCSRRARTKMREGSVLRAWLAGGGQWATEELQQTPFLSLSSPLRCPRRSRGSRPPCRAPAPRAAPATRPIFASALCGSLVLHAQDRESLVLHAQETRQALRLSCSAAASSSLGAARLSEAPAPARFPSPSRPLPSPAPQPLHRLSSTSIPARAC